MFRDILDLRHKHTPLQAVGWYIIWLLGTLAIAVVFSLLLGILAGASPSSIFFVSRIVVAFGIVIILGSSFAALEKKGELAPDRPIYILLAVAGGMLGYFGLPIGLIVPAYFTTLAQRHQLGLGGQDPNQDAGNGAEESPIVLVSETHEPVEASTLGEVWRGVSTPPGVLSHTPAEPILPPTSPLIAPPVEEAKLESGE